MKSSEIIRQYAQRCLQRAENQNSTTIISPEIKKAFDAHNRLVIKLYRHVSLCRQCSFKYFIEEDASPMPIFRALTKDCSKGSSLQVAQRTARRKALRMVRKEA